jgi:HEPN domain-containing protein
MNDHVTLTRGWLRKADSDLADARRTVASEGPYDTACFHSQQAIEKTLKAFLALHQRPLPRTHDLEELGRLCQQIDPLADLSLPALADATDYAVHIRYDFDVWPSQEEARQAVLLAERIRAMIVSRLPGEALS